MIGFTPQNEALLGFLTPFLFNPVWLKGDGSQDLFAEFSATFNHTFAEALNDEPFFTHFLKGVKSDFRSRLYDGTRDIIVKAMNDNWALYQPFLTQFPFLSTIFLYTKLGGLLEFDCDDELKEQIKEFVQENMPPACMSLKDMLSFVK